MHGFPFQFVLVTNPCLIIFSSPCLCTGQQLSWSMVQFSWFCFFLILCPMVIIYSTTATNNHLSPEPTLTSVCCHLADISFEHCLTVCLINEVKSYGIKHYVVPLFVAISTYLNSLLMKSLCFVLWYGNGVCLADTADSV